LVALNALTDSSSATFPIVVLIVVQNLLFANSPVLMRFPISRHAVGGGSGGGEGGGVGGGDGGGVGGGDGGSNPHTQVRSMLFSHVAVDDMLVL